MNLEVINLLLTIGLAIYVAIFSIRNTRRMKDIAESVERCCEVIANSVNNIVRFRQPGVQRSGVVMRDEEYHRCTLHGRDEA